MVLCAKDEWHQNRRNACLLMAQVRTMEGNALAVLWSLGVAGWLLAGLVDHRGGQVSARLRHDRVVCAWRGRRRSTVKSMTVSFTASSV